MIAGKRDAVAIQFAKDLIANGQANAAVELGWEGNQANAANDPASSVLACQHIMGVAKGVAGQKFPVLVESGDGERNDCGIARG